MLCLVEFIASHLKYDVIVCYVWLARCDYALCLVSKMLCVMFGWIDCISSKRDVIVSYVWLS